MADFSRTMAVRRPRSLCFPVVPQSTPSRLAIAWIKTTTRLRPTSAASAVRTRQTRVIAISARTSSEPRTESPSEPARQPYGHATGALIELPRISGPGNERRIQAPDLDGAPPAEFFMVISLYACSHAGRLYGAKG